MKKFHRGNMTTQELLDNPEKAVELLKRAGVHVELGQPNLKEVKNYSARLATNKQTVKLG